MEMTITEALAELKLIEKKVAAKIEFIEPRLAHTEPENYSWNDEFLDVGGIEKKVGQEMQAIRDLLHRKAAIRVAINEANLVNTITIGSDERTIAEWLAWRRETYPEQLRITRRILDICNRLQDARAPILERDKKQGAVVLHVDVSDLQVQYENLITCNERLDGQLSLRNAQIMVDIP